MLDFATPFCSKNQIFYKKDDNKNFAILSTSSDKSDTINSTNLSKNKHSFNQILNSLARRQLFLDFQFNNAALDYEPVRTIGAGGFGIVCEALCLKNKTKTNFLNENNCVDIDKNYCNYNDRVAIKKIAHASATPTLSRRTLRELRVLRYISHPNIVSLRDAFCTENGKLGLNVFLVMNIMEGNLHQLIYGCTAETLNYNLIAHLLFQILCGLRYLHTGDIAHRDLKPSNLLINRYGHLQIADFGMAKVINQSHFDNTDENCLYMTQHIATLPYRAPELLFGMTEHSLAVDMWAVGCIFGEMILRRELFSSRNVNNQIKTIIFNLGTPSQKLFTKIRCNKTRQYIQSFGTKLPLPWSEIICSRDLPQNDKALSLINDLMQMDANDRLNVHDAIYHPFFKINFTDIPFEQNCPFTIKMNIAAVEFLSHKQIIEAIKKEIRCANSVSGNNQLFQQTYNNTQNKKQILNYCHSNISSTILLSNEIIETSTNCAFTSTTASTTDDENKEADFKTKKNDKLLKSLHNCVNHQNFNKTFNNHNSENIINQNYLNIKSENRVSQNLSNNFSSQENFCTEIPSKKLSTELVKEYSESIATINKCSVTPRIKKISVAKHQLTNNSLNSEDFKNLSKKKTEKNFCLKKANNVSYFNSCNEQKLLNNNNQQQLINIVQTRPSTSADISSNKHTNLTCQKFNYLNDFNNNSYIFSNQLFFSSKLDETIILNKPSHWFLNCYDIKTQNVFFKNNFILFKNKSTSEIAARREDLYNSYKYYKQIAQLEQKKLNRILPRRPLEKINYDFKLLSSNRVLNSDLECDV